MEMEFSLIYICGVLPLRQCLGALTDRLQTIDGEVAEVVNS